MAASRCAQLRVAVLWLCAAAGAFGQSPFDDPEHGLDPWRLRVEVYSRGVSFVHVGTSEVWLGFSSWNWSSENALLAHIEKGRWRIGTAVSEEIMGLDLVYSYAPVRVDFIVWERPLWYAWRLHGMVPDLALHLSGYWLNNTGDRYLRVPAAARLDAVSGVDFLGLGLSVSAGIVAARTAHNHAGRGWKGDYGFSPNIEIRLRALSFGLDLGD